MLDLMHTAPMFLAAGSGKELDPMSHVLPHTLFDSVWFHNHHFMTLVAMIVGVVVFSLLAGRIRHRTDKGIDGYVTKGGFSQLLETVCVYLRDEMARPILGKLTDKYIYYIWTVFFFILLGNILGLIPFGAFFGLTLGKSASHFGGTFTGNLAFTGGLAMISLVMMFFIGLRENGIGFFTHMWVVPMKPAYLIPVMVVVGIMVFIIEFLGLFIKAFALAVRLFANMVAGHLVLGSLIILVVMTPGVAKGVGVIGAAAFSFLELFVAFLQAYVFTFLTVIFISLGAVHHGEHDEHEAGLDEGELPGDATSEGLTGTVAAH